MIYFIMFTTSKKNIYKKPKKFSKKNQTSKKNRKKLLPLSYNPLDGA